MPSTIYSGYDVPITNLTTIFDSLANSLNPCGVFRVDVATESNADVVLVSLYDSQNRALTSNFPVAAETSQEFEFEPSLICKVAVRAISTTGLNISSNPIQIDFGIVGARKAF